VDFYLEDRAEILEVIYDLDLEHVKKVIKAMEELNISRATIITWDEGFYCERGRKKVTQPWS